MAQTCFAAGHGMAVMALETGGAPDHMEDGPAESLTLGDGLREGRERSGRSLAELSAQTRIPARYLRALEQNDFSVLPTRAFSIGYVRAYASALGLDEQEAVERFRRESPDPSVPLQAPVGVAFEDVRRNSPRIIAAIVIVLIAVIGWNVFQRLSLAQAPQPSDIAAVPEAWTRDGDVPFRLSPSHPAPPDQTTPVPYITPGLEAALTGIDPAAVDAPVVPEPPVQRAFNPRGALYGAPASASQVVLQTRKPTVLVVRLGGGQILFARQLAEGDAWRAPLDAAATIDATEPEAFDVYLNGEHAGTLTAPLTPLAGLNARARARASQLAAEAAAQVEAARRAAEAQALTRAAQTPPATATPTP